MLYSPTVPPTTAYPARRRALEVPAGSSTTWNGLSGFTDKVFALLSISLVVVACVIAMRVWIEPGWAQVLVVALIYLQCRVLIGFLFDAKAKTLDS